MKRQQLCAVLLTAALVGCGGSARVHPSETDEQVRRLSSILDYVGADYAEAVQNGTIVDAGEYQEQIAFLEDAGRMARALPSPPRGAELDLDAEIASLLRLVRDKAEAAQVSAGCRRLRRHLLDSYGVVIAPRSPPSRERGGALYAQICAHCHGPNGAGDGPQARGLRPPPRSFQDDEVMHGLSPVRAFNALTDGIEGTAMLSFGALTESDRWSLAFHIFGLRHTEDAATRGQRVLKDDEVPGLSIARLAEATDRDLLQQLENGGVGSIEERHAALAHLRRLAPYQQSGHPLARAHELVPPSAATRAATTALPWTRSRPPTSTASNRSKPCCMAATRIW